jgi:hypothetical protein
MYSAGHVRIVLALLCYLFGLALLENSNATEGNGDKSATTNTMKITIGSNTFTVSLDDNPTVDALKPMLPLTIEMIELNGNEKYFDLPTKLPAAAAKPNTIQAGDLMLWESSTLVLFYKSFATSYSYTRIGRIENASGLAAAVGPGNVTVKLELEAAGK